jgi:hypothetical protein
LGVGIDGTGAVATMGGAGAGEVDVVTVAFDGVVGGALTIAVDGSGFTGAVTRGGRTGVLCATVAAGGAGLENGGERNHAISTIRRMASSAACSIERARCGFSDL